MSSFFSQEGFDKRKLQVIHGCQTPEKILEVILTGKRGAKRMDFGDCLVKLGKKG